jgi:hypothetical protein
MINGSCDLTDVALVIPRPAGKPFDDLEHLGGLRHQVSAPFGLSLAGETLLTTEIHPSDNYDFSDGRSMSSLTGRCGRSTGHNSESAMQIPLTRRLFRRRSAGRAAARTVRTKGGSTAATSLPS